MRKLIMVAAAVALFGSAQLSFAAGADEVVLSPVGVGPDPEKSYERALEVLGELARSR